MRKYLFIFFAGGLMAAIGISQWTISQNFLVSVLSAAGALAFCVGIHVIGVKDGQDIQRKVKRLAWSDNPFQCKDTDLQTLINETAYMVSDGTSNMDEALLWKQLLDKVEARLASTDWDAFRSRFHEAWGDAKSEQDYNKESWGHVQSKLGA